MGKVIFQLGGVWLLQRYFLNTLVVISFFGLWLMPSLATARVFPTPKGESNFNFIVLRNFDQFHRHWGAGFGFCWSGRLDVNLEMRQDGHLGHDLLIFQSEVALIRTTGFALETGYHFAIQSSRRNDLDLIPVRASFFFETFDKLHRSPSITFWHILDYDGLVNLAFVGLDFFWERRFSLGFELNVNQDFRYHNLDVRFGYHW